MKGKIGFDLDGVLASQDLKYLMSLDELKEKNRSEWFELIADYFAGAVPLLTEHLFTGEKIVIITARDKDFEPLTDFWIRFFYGDNHALYCVGYDKNTAQRKAEIMKEENITTFVDDNKKWIDTINKNGINGIHWEIEQ